jgi:hypothetical protein
MQNFSILIYSLISLPSSILQTCLVQMCLLYSTLLFISNYLTFFLRNTSMCHKTFKINFKIFMCVPLFNSLFNQYALIILF